MTGAVDWVHRLVGFSPPREDVLVARAKAYAASGAKSAPPQWIMGFITYVPKTEATQTAQPFIWNVQFDPGTSGATPNIVEVNATTGETKVATATPTGQGQ